MARSSLDDPEGHRAMQIVSLAIGLDHIGIAKSLKCTLQV
jgi:hypothetical protein